MRIGGNRGREGVVSISGREEEVVNASASVATSMLESRKRGWMTEFGDIHVLRKNRSEARPGRRKRVPMVKGGPVNGDVRVGVPVASEKVEGDEAKRVRSETIEERAAVGLFRVGVDICESKLRGSELNGSEENAAIIIRRRVHEGKTRRKENPTMVRPGRRGVPF